MHVVQTKGNSTTMGMAASQARFLGLTARKNNVEFEGQQINQQRTTLSNQSANYYNDLLGMAVPIPPSVDDFTKTVYSFEDGALTNQITAMIAQNDGTYKVSYLRQWVDDFSVVSAATTIINRTESSSQFVYNIGAQELRPLNKLKEDMASEYTGNYLYNGQVLRKGSVITTSDGAYNLQTYTYKDYEGNDAYLYVLKNGDEEYWYMDDPYYVATGDESSIIPLEGAVPIEEERTIVEYSGNDEYLSTLSEEQLKNLLKEEEEYLKLLQAKYGDGDYLVRYVKNTTTEEWNPYFYRAQDLENAVYDENGNSQSNISCYKIGSETKAEEVKAVGDCRIEKDSSGRYINLTMPQHDKDGNIVPGTNITYALTTSTVTDQAKYEDAMNQYEFEKYQYDQAIQDINAKIEIIQSEDKNLELRLKQLDTEQKAISTELESVGNVIQKNTESSFKTFG